MSAVNQFAQQAVSLTAERTPLIAATMERIRNTVTAEGISPGTLEQVRAELLKLAERQELFSETEFPLQYENGRARPYLLSEEDDFSFSMILLNSKRKVTTPPHDHDTSWAVIVSVAGEEHNRFFERTDDGRTEGKGTLRQTYEETVRPGVGVTLMPGQVHAISTSGEEVTRHLHLYGLAQRKQVGRVAYNVEEGTYKVFGANAGLIDSRGQ